MNIDLTRIHKILIIQFSRMGDVLLNTGYLPYLRRKFPTAKIDFLVSKPFHKMLLNNENIDELIIFDKKATGMDYTKERLALFREIRKRKYDLVIDQNRATGSVQVAFLSGARYRLGFDEFKWRFLYNIRVKVTRQRYSASLKFDLLNPLGITEGPYRLQYHIRPQSIADIKQYLQSIHIQTAPYVCMVPGSLESKKKWRTDLFAELADRIVAETGYRILIISGPGEEKDGKTLKRLMLHPAEQVPPMDIDQVAALMRQSRLVVCNDGGLSHLSVAIDVPSLVIFGNTNPIHWAPVLFDRHEHLYNPDFDRKSDRSFGITVDAAYAKVCALLNVKGAIHGSC